MSPFSYQTISQGLSEFMCSTISLKHVLTIFGVQFCFEKPLTEALKLSLSLQSMQNLLGSINSLDVGGFYEALDSAGELDPLTRGKVQEFMKEINKIKVHRKKNLEEVSNNLISH